MSGWKENLSADHRQQEQKVAMILGGFLADAATMGLHWIYKQADIESKLQASEHHSVDSCVFFEPPSCPFYQHEPGKLSPWGEEVVPLLALLGSSEPNRADPDKETLAKSCYNHYKSYEGYKNGTIKKFLEKWEAGNAYNECAIEDSQAHGLIKVPVLVARYTGQDTLHTRISDSVAILQNSEVSRDISLLGAILLERVLQNDCSPKDAIEWAASADAHSSFGPQLTDRMKSYLKLATNSQLVDQLARLYGELAKALELFPSLGLAGKLRDACLATGATSLEDAVAAAELADSERASVTEAISRMEQMQSGTLDDTTLMNLRGCAMGLSCGMPGALLTSLVIALNCPNQTFEEIVKMNILVGGDNCSRSIFLGALYACSVGGKFDQVCDAWLEKCHPQLREVLLSCAYQVPVC